MDAFEFHREMIASRERAALAAETLKEKQLRLVRATVDEGAEAFVDEYVAKAFDILSGEDNRRLEAQVRKWEADPHDLYSSIMLSRHRFYQKEKPFSSKLQTDSRIPLENGLTEGLFDEFTTRFSSSELKREFKEAVDRKLTSRGFKPLPCRFKDSVSCVVTLNDKWDKFKAAVTLYSVAMFALVVFWTLAVMIMTGAFPAESVGEAGVLLLLTAGLSAKFLYDVPEVLRTIRNRGQRFVVNWRVIVRREEENDLLKAFTFKGDVLEAEQELGSEYEDVACRMHELVDVTEERVAHLV